MLLGNLPGALFISGRMGNTGNGSVHAGQADVRHYSINEEQHTRNEHDGTRPLHTRLALCRDLTPR